MFGRLLAFVRADRAGKTDGKKRIPIWDGSEHSPYMDQLSKDGRTHMAKLEARHDKSDRPLLRRFNDAREISNAQQKEVTEAQRVFDDALVQYEQQHGHKPAVVRPLSSFWLWLCLLFLVLGEVPLTFLAFGALALPGWMQLFVALVIGVVTAACAHQLGGLVQEGPFRDVRNSVQTVICILLPLGAMVFLSYIRENYTAALQKMNNSQNEGLEGVPVVNMNPMLVFMAFVFINMMLYVVAVYLSSQLHDPLRLAFTALRKATSKLKGAERRLRLDYTTRVNHALLFHSYAQQIVHSFESPASAYKKANLLCRDIDAERQNSIDPQRGQPLSFGKPLSIDIPTHFRDPEDPNVGLKW